MKKLWTVLMAAMCVGMAQAMMAGNVQARSEGEALAMMAGEALRAGDIVQDVLTGKCGENVTWSMDRKVGVLTIEGTGEMTDFEYEQTGPAEYKCSAPWFALRDEIKEIRVGEGVTSIGNCAFFYLKNSLTSVELPETVHRIGEYAFFMCLELEDFELPSSVRTLEKGAFYDAGMRSISLNDAITSIPDFCFQGCFRLEHIDLPAHLQSIGWGAFLVCYSLSEVELPASLRTIGKQAFQQTPMEHVVLPAGLETIGKFAFVETELTDVTCLGSTPPVADAQAFVDDDDVAIPITLHVPDGAKEAYGQKVPWMNFEEIHDYTDDLVKSGTCGENMTWSVDRETGVLTIEGEGEMDNYSWILEDGKYVSKAPWAPCVKLIKEIHVGEGVTALGNGAFLSLTEAESIDLPEGLKTVGIYAFHSCSSLTAIELPSTVTTVKSAVFQGCSALEEITWPAQLTSIPQSTFMNCHSLRKVNLPEGLVSIERYAFANCDALGEITLPETVRRIDDMAFSGCEALHEVTCLGSSPAGLSDKAFDKVEGEDYIAGTLHVPDGAVGAYMKDYDWRKFYTILPQSGNDPNDIAAMDYTMYVSSVSLKPGEVVELPIMVKNAGELKSIEGQLILPEGLTLEGEDIGEIEYTLNEDRWQGGRPGYGIPCAIAMEERPTIYVDNRMGFWQVKQEDSPLMTVRLKADPDMKGGTYEGSVYYNINDYTRRGTLKFCINVEKGYECTHVQGDVNGDGKVSIADVNRLVEILKKLKIEN